MANPQLLHKPQPTLRSLKPPSPTALTLQMINQPTEHHEFPPTARTMIDLLSMDRTSKMIIQIKQLPKTTLAQIASIPRSVPSGAGCIISRRCCIVVVPANLLVGEDMIGVDLAAVLIDFGSVDA